MQWKIGSFVAFSKGVTFVKSIERLTSVFTFADRSACLNNTVEKKFPSRYLFHNLEILSESAHFVYQIDH